MATVSLPQFTGSVDSRLFIEPLNAPTAPQRSLSRFPDNIYTKSPDSHFVRFMTTLLGPVGVGWLKFNLTVARLELEGNGLQQAGLEAFYGDPFSFGRILDENYDDDVSGVLPLNILQMIRARDEAYRSRAIQFLHATRLGNSPAGMQLAASSGSGQVDVIENYRYLFDAHSDRPLGLPRYGSSGALGEFVVVPRPVVSRTQQQIIAFSQTSLGTNLYTITFNGYATPSLDPTTTGTTGSGQTAADVQTALWALPTIGSGNVIVSGGPAPADFTITFTGALTNQALPALQVKYASTVVPVETVTGALDPSSETVVVGDADRHAMQVALDRLRPVASYPTFHPGAGIRRPQLWTSVTGSSQYTTVLRYVTGNPAITWPATDVDHWIVPSQEVEAPQLSSEPAQHYVNFHNVLATSGYSDTALADPNYGTTLPAGLPQYASYHVGPFPEMASVIPFFRQFSGAFTQAFAPDLALALTPDPLTVTGLSADGTAFLNGVYPADYTSLQGVSPLQSNDAAFWSSACRSSGAEILEIDLGTAQAVNFVTFEVTRKPVAIELDYDLLDQSPSRTFAPVVPVPGFPTLSQVFYDPAQQNPWETVQLYFTDGQHMIFTRFIRLVFTRQPASLYEGFLFDASTQTQTQWSIEVRNLRVGRNVAPQVM